MGIDNRPAAAAMAMIPRFKASLGEQAPAPDLKPQAVPKYRTKTLPVEDANISQPYGVNYAGPGFYSGLNGGGPDTHDGIDIATAVGQPIKAVISGEARFEDFGEDGGRKLVIRNKDLGIEVSYSHISGPVRADGWVDEGEAVAFAGNTGNRPASGPHTHLGFRDMTYGAGGEGPYLSAYKDPTNLFDDSAWYKKGTEFAKPVDSGYGIKGAPPLFGGAVRYAEGKLGRALTDREAKALREGGWDIESVADPAMLPVWGKMTKAEAVKRGIVKP